MIYARFVLFNYRLIVANFLIYDLIATTSAANAATPLPAIFMTHKTDAPLGSVNASNDLLLQSPPLPPLPVPVPALMTMMERAKTTSASSAPSDQPLPAKSVRRLSRPKRYLSFPEGSSFTVCVTVTLDIDSQPRSSLSPLSSSNISDFLHFSLLRLLYASQWASLAILTMPTIVTVLIGAWPTICPTIRGSCRACTASHGIPYLRLFYAVAPGVLSIRILKQSLISNT